MGKTRKYVQPTVIEKEMQEARNAEEFTGKIETITIKQIRF